MSKRLVLAGAGAFGRVVESWVSNSAKFRAEKDISEVVFIDDRTPDIKPESTVISTIREYEPEENDLVICTVGRPKSRNAVTELLAAKGVTFTTFVDDSVIYGKNVHFGIGIVICPGVVIQPNCQIHNHVHVGSNCAIGHDTTIGEYTSLSPMVNLMSSISVSENVFFGGSSTIIPNVMVSSNAIIGAGAVVVKDIPGGVTVTGVPGRWNGQSEGKES